MLTTALLTLLTLPTLPLLVTSAALKQKQEPLSHQPQHPQTSTQDHDNKQLRYKTQFRPISRPDLPSITTLILEAFTPWPTWKYLMPSYEEHKAEIWDYMFLQLQHAYERYEKVDAELADGKKREMGRVITVSKRDFDKQSGMAREDDDGHEDESDSEEEQVAVSVALWQVLTHHHPHSSSSPKRTALSSPLSPNLLFAFISDITTTSSQLPPYTNLTRAAHFNNFMSPIMDKYIFSAYPRQLYLHLLATHPSWDGNGFGARQVEWGEGFSERLAEEGDLRSSSAEGVEEEKGVPLTLLATPVGWENLYEEMGFEGLRNVTYEMLDGEGELWWEVGRWGYEGDVGETSLR